MRPPAAPPEGPLGAWAGAAAGAFSANTERALKADLRIYAAWCAEEGRQALPATPATIAAFVDAMAATRAPATVRRYVASIAVAHRAVGSPTTTRSPPVKLALQRLRRREGRRRDQVVGLTRPLGRRLIEAAGDRLIDARNCALLAIAYDAMLRRSELVSLQVGDLSEKSRGGARLRVRGSEAAGGGRGETARLSRDTVRLVRAWLGRGGIADGRLFRSVGRGGRVGERLDPSQVPRIYKAMARRAGLPEAVVRGLSGHSPRVGAAQDMLAAGIGLPAIQQAGRWKSAAMVNRYGERLLAATSGAAQLARMQSRE